MRLSEVAGKVGLAFSGRDIEVTGVQTLAQAGPEQIAPLFAKRHATEAAASRAGAIFCSAQLAPEGRSCLLGGANVRLDWAHVVALFARPQGCLSGISPQAYVHPDAELGAGVTVYPFAFVGPRAKIGAGSTLYPGVYVGEDCVLGAGCTVYPNAVLLAGCELGRGVSVDPGAVLGGDGFGFAQSPQGHVKIPQLGHVVVGDDVEIGANACIDRAALDATRIGPNTKIDNLVQIAHNVVTGPSCLIISQAGVAGSTHLGTGVVLAGQAGVRDNVTLGDGALVAAQAGVGQDLPAGSRSGGSPCMDARTFLRVSMSLPKLPELLRRVRKLEKALADAEGKEKQDK